MQHVQKVSSSGGRRGKATVRCNVAGSTSRAASDLVGKPGPDDGVESASLWAKVLYRFRHGVCDRNRRNKPRMCNGQRWLVTDNLAADELVALPLCRVKPRERPHAVPLDDYGT